MKAIRNRFLLIVLCVVDKKNTIREEFIDIFLYERATGEALSDIIGCSKSLAKDKKNTPFKVIRG